MQAEHTFQGSNIAKLPPSSNGLKKCIESLAGAKIAAAKLSLEKIVLSSLVFFIKTNKQKWESENVIAKQLNCF